MSIGSLVINSNKKTVSMVNIKSVKKYYASLLSVARVQLYDMGWIEDPTHIDSYEIRSLLCNYPELFSLLTTNQGILATLESGYTSKVLDELYTFAEYKVQDEELKGFLKAYKDVIKYSSYCRSIDGVYAKLRVKKKGVNMSLARSGSMVYCKNGVEVNKGFIQAFYPFTDIECYSIKKAIYVKALSLLGINTKQSEGVFIKGFTMEQEVDMAESILNGIIKYDYIDGKYGQWLKNWLQNQKTELGVYANHALGLYNHILQNQSEYMIECQEHAYNKLKEDGLNVVSLNTDTFFTLKGEMKSLTYPLSAFVIDSTLEETLPECNVLEGFTGEVVPASDDVIFTGCPIQLYNKDGIYTEYFLKEDVLRVDGDWNSVFLKFDGRLNFDDEVDANFVFKDGLTQKLFDAVVRSKTGVLLDSVDCTYSEFKKSREKIVSKLLGGLDGNNSEN